MPVRQVTAVTTQMIQVDSLYLLYLLYLLRPACTTAADVSSRCIMRRRVLLPPPVPSPPPPPPTIASVASGVDVLSTLVAAVSASPAILAAASDPTTAVTVLAPTNDAFAAALSMLGLTAEQLLADTELLTTILSYHISPTVFTADAAPASPISLPTLLPYGNITVQRMDGNVMVNNATVVVADVMAGPSVVHVIDMWVAACALRAHECMHTAPAECVHQEGHIINERLSTSAKKKCALFVWGDAQVTL
eukprot:156410-Chlamydomonas_euryale.AAC.4